MGKIGDWLDRHLGGILAGVVIAGIGTCTGGIAYSYYQEYLKRQPEGIAVKAEADGVVAPEEESEINNYLYDIKNNEYSSTMSGLVNDFDVFLVREFKWNRRIIGNNVHIAIESEEDVAKDCEVSTWYGGCYKALNSTIYLKKTCPIALFKNIQHELGHSLRKTPHKNNYLKELPSQANEFYALFRLQNFSMAIGTYYAANNSVPAIKYVKEECKLDEKEVPYMLGAIGFLVQANKEGGNLERAMHNVINAAESQLEKDTREAVSGYANACSAYIGEYEKLLQQPGLIAGLEKQMSAEEAEKFIELLRTKIPEIK